MSRFTFRTTKYGAANTKKITAVLIAPFIHTSARPIIVPKRSAAAMIAPMIHITARSNIAIIAQ